MDSDRVNNGDKPDMHGIRQLRGIGHSRASDIGSVVASKPFRMF